MQNESETQPISDIGEPPQDGKRKLLLGRLLRFFGWWLGFTGLYSMTGTCPVCGQQGCPVGLASAGIVGAFFALCVQNWKRFFGFLRSRI
jgi:hypothetical protein